MRGCTKTPCMVPAPHSSAPPDTLTVSVARPRRRWGGAERPPADCGAASPAGTVGSSPRRPSVPVLLPSQRLPFIMAPTMGSLPWASTCITMQACPYTLRPCHVILPLSSPFLLLLLREACAYTINWPHPPRGGAGGRLGLAGSWWRGKDGYALRLDRLHQTALPRYHSWANRP